MEERAKALKQLGESLNFTFAEKSDKLLMDLSGFHLFSQGSFRRISNVLTGTFKSVPMTIMDYRYATGAGRSLHARYQTVLSIESEKLQLPPFVVRPEHLLDKIGRAFGKKDINFESAPAFSKRYVLRGDDEEPIRNLFNARVLEYYEQHLGLSTEGNGARLIYYRTSKSVSPDKMNAFLQEGYDAFTLFKI